MEALFGFIVGYFFGTKSGPTGFDDLRRSWKAISASDEFKGIKETGISMIGGMVKQGLKGRF